MCYDCRAMEITAETVGAHQAAALSVLGFITVHVLVAPTALPIRIFSRRARQDWNTPWTCLLWDVQCCYREYQQCWAEGGVFFSFSLPYVVLQESIFHPPPPCSEGPDAPRYSLDAQQHGCIPAGSCCWLASFQPSSRSIRNLRTD